MDNMHCLQIPTPFNVGRVNCYLFMGNGLTLLDPGPATETAYDELSAGLVDQGFEIADVDRVLITHPHMDHFGLANRIIEESGAIAVAHEDASRALADPGVHFHREQSFFRPFLQAMGVPTQVVESTLTLPEAYTDYQEPLRVDSGVTDGDIIDMDTGLGLRAVHTPGHAPGSVCFVTETEGIAFTGDHVLEHITPNPLLTLKPGTDDERTRSLPTYLDSLNTLRDVNVGIGHGGHGKLISDLNSRIQEIFDHHQSRKERIADIIAENGQTSAYDIMQEMFPDLPATEVFTGMSEVIGHLDLLEDENRVRITEVDDVRHYRLR